MMTRSDGAGGGIADSNLSRYLDHIPELWTDIWIMFPPPLPILQHIVWIYMYIQMAKEFYRFPILPKS